MHLGSYLGDKLTVSQAPDQMSGPILPSPLSLCKSIGPQAPVLESLPYPHLSVSPQPWPASGLFSSHLSLAQPLPQLPELLFILMWPSGHLSTPRADSAPPMAPRNTKTEHQDSVPTPRGDI